MGNFMGMFPPKTKRITELTREQMSAELHPAQKIHVRLSESYNEARSEEFRRRTRIGTRIAIVLASLSLATYFWTMFSLKQEKLGPEFDIRLVDTEEEKKT